MSYQVLARKWRPRTFTDIVGQEHTIRLLTNALNQKRLHHAYLFTGTRGVGKTTFARILAKSFNCATDITSTPCGQCHACMAIDAGHFLDLFEVDAASRTKVEDTRELLENVYYPPSQGRYKIYLIDEVHMLSHHSFNALLKTLEEPPDHVKFILATTDPKRLPATILSRCLQFHLKRIPVTQISEHLQHICTLENILYDKESMVKLAKAADGSMRDALSLLDQAIAYSQGKIELTQVNSLLGSVAQADVLPLLHALAAQDGKQLFIALAHLAERVPDYQQVLEELIGLLHQIAIAQVVPDAMPLADDVAPLCQQIAAEDLHIYYQIALLGRRDLFLAPTPQQGLEITLLRMFAFKPALYQQQPNPCPVEEQTLAKLPPLDADAAHLSTAKPAAMTQAIPPKDWRHMLSQLKLSGMAHALAANCVLEKMSGNKISLAISMSHQPMLNQKLKERIASALSDYLQQPIQLEIKVCDTELPTPNLQQQQEQEQLLAKSKTAMMHHPQIKKLVDMYDATVEVSLIQGQSD